MITFARKMGGSRYASISGLTNSVDPSLARFWNINPTGGSCNIQLVAPTKLNPGIGVVYINNMTGSYTINVNDSNNSNLGQITTQAVARLDLLSNSGSGTWAFSKRAIGGATTVPAMSTPGTIYPIPTDPRRTGIGGNIRRMATLVQIQRTDGVLIQVTDHDTILQDIKGNLYQPSGGFSPSARQRNTGTTANNMELVGVIDSNLITHTDLREGRFDDAQVTWSIVDPLYPWQCVYSMDVFWVGHVQFSKNMWTAQLGSIVSRLQQPTGVTVSRTCLHAFGDAKCNRDGATSLAAWTTNSVAVTSVSSTIQFGATSLGQSDSYFTYGFLTWVTGNNAGDISEISAHLNAGGTITLFTAPANPILVGDTFNITVGCNRNKTTCKNKFSNINNFGGQPYVPGNLKVLYPLI